MKTQEKRRRNGVRTRAEYEANSISKTKPWEAAGFKCRRTWERHRVASPSPLTFPVGTGDSLATTSAAERTSAGVSMEISAIPQQEPTTVTSLADFLARRKAAAIVWRDVSDAPQKIAA